MRAMRYDNEENLPPDDYRGGELEGVSDVKKVMKVRVNFRIVNGHYQLCCNHHINLQELKKLIPCAELHLGRPTMLSCRILRKRVLFFPKGTIQILAGGMTRYLFYQIFLVIYHHLQQLISETIHLTRWSVNNIVVHFDLKSKFSFDKLVCNGKVSYEPEIFPAALISKWRSSPKHVTLFPNGKGIITGIHRRSQAIDILQDIIVDFKSRLR